MLQRCALVLFCFSLFSDGLFAETLELRGGISIELPSLPDDPALKEKFLELPPEARERFYQRRIFLLEKIVGTLSFPKTIGGLLWTKNKIGSALRWIRNKEEKNHSPLQEVAGGQGRQFLESIVTGFVDQMWQDSGYIAGAGGVGFTFVGGTVANFSLARWGLFWGRSLSIDVGQDFNSGKGYVRVYYDKQSLKRAGFSFDTGLMFDALVHFRDLPEAEKRIEIDHVKLPLIGCFRKGPEYLGYGLQMGVHVFEMAGVALTFYGYPELGTPLALGTRMLGAATIYSTHLKRNLLKKLSLSADQARRIWRPQRSCEKDLVN